MIVTQQLHSRSSHGERNGKFSQNGKLGHLCTKVTEVKLYDSWVRDHVIVRLGLNVSSSAHNCGCVSDGGDAMAAILVLIILLYLILPKNYKLSYKIRGISKLKLAIIIIIIIHNYFCKIRMCSIWEVSCIMCFW